MPPKEAAPDPEIPDELRSSLNRPHRPAGYTPKSEAAEDDNPKADAPRATPLRNLDSFFAKLAEVMKTGAFEEMPEEYEVRVKGKIEARTRNVMVKVLDMGANGLPYPVVPVTADMTRRIRAKNYAGAPQQNPGLGDLTPEFVEWLYLNYTFDAVVRYNARSTHVQAAAVERMS